MHNKKVFDLILDESVRMAGDLMFKYVKEMDLNPPELINGKVKVHPSIKAVMRECGRGGWITSSFPIDEGGDQLPAVITNSTRFVFTAANYSSAVFLDMSAGVAHLITSFGSRQQVQTYVPHLFNGKWQGTMALTEPQAGSSLTDISTTAYPTEQGYYRIQGQKIFISGADHDAVDNVVNLMLARIEGAPPGVKGISLFIVPQKRIAENGSLVPNDVTVTQVYHKLGYKGTPLTELAIGEAEDCRGYLVGEPHQGLKYMFQMMNDMRIEVGLGAAGVASAAYYAALAHTKDRTQGRRIGEKDPLLPQVPIIQHADIKRMLLFQRAVVEGSLSLLLQCGWYEDMKSVSEAKDREKYHMLLDLLTPIAKSYPSEMGVLATSAGLQCLGGYGFCDDFPLQQYYRDIRIHHIHEGTTGIQAIDLLGRKVAMQNGKALTLYIEELHKTIDEAGKIQSLSAYAGQLVEAVEKLKAVTANLRDLADRHGQEAYLADATLYLEMFGTIAIAWQWLLQALVIHKALDKKRSKKESNFYQGKLLTFRYFFEYELPKIQGPASRLMQKEPLTMEMEPAFFND